MSTSHRSKTSELEFYGLTNTRCGYCKNNSNDPEERARFSYDMESIRLTAQDYQELLDLGWRRSGLHCYKVLNRSTCCPNLTMSCKATKFRLQSRSMRRCVRRLNAFLLTGNLNSDPQLNLDQMSSQTLGEPRRDPAKTFTEIQNSSKARDRRFVKACLKYQRTHGIDLDEAAQRVRDKWSKVSLVKGNLQPNRLNLEQYLYFKTTREPKHRLSIDLVLVETERNIEEREEEHRIMQEYQQAVHGEQPSDWDITRYCDFLIDSPLIVEPLCNFDHVKSTSEPHSKQDIRSIHVDLNGSLTLPQNYYLVQPPPLPTSFGTYHCNYRLDGKLIATGVLDILPKSISSVYLFYDPKYSFLELGTYSALTEIALVRRLAQRFHNTSSNDTCKLVHYYLGLYVHKCPKMRYKTRYKPSYVLCDETLEYVPTDKALAKLGQDVNYSVFSDTPVEEPKLPTLEELLLIPVSSPLDRQDQDEVLRLDFYWDWAMKHFTKRQCDILMLKILLPYTKLVGLTLAHRMILRLWLSHEYFVRCIAGN